MATVKCNVCWTNCVSCAGGKCRWCWFTVKQTEFSNSILDNYSVDFSIDGIIEYYKSIIKASDTLWYNSDDIINMLKDYTPEKQPVVTEQVNSEKPKILPQNTWELCEYESWAVWARDQCKLCGVSRFYWQNKPCIYKIKNK